MLRQRVITALVLLAVLLPALFADARWPFVAVSVLMIAAAAWEWARLNAQTETIARLCGLAMAALCGWLAWAGWTDTPPVAIWWVGATAWVVGGAVALRSGPASWPKLGAGMRLGTGLLLLATGWLALVHARSIGINFILSVLCLVWMADVAAYFGGRAFGRRKLAPSISPGKSWEGVWSGLLGVAVLALAWATIEQGRAWDSASLYALLFSRYGHVPGLLLLAGLTAMSVVGDLVESLAKRAVGAKDSSALLPGHGGVLDRVDALLPVFPIAMAVVAT